MANALPIEIDAATLDAAVAAAFPGLPEGMTADEARRRVARALAAAQPRIAALAREEALNEAITALDETPGPGRGGMRAWSVKVVRRVANPDGVE